MAQLPLPLILGRHNRFETFVAGPNATAVSHLNALADSDEAAAIWIAGGSGVGKTHLLQAITAESRQPAMYVPLSIVQDRGTDVLNGLEGLGLLALDDLDAVSGRQDWERALFSLFNAVSSAGGKLAMAASDIPSRIGFSLADLESRATAAVVYRLERLGDDDSLDALQRHASARGLELPEAAARYLLARVARDMTVVCGWLDELDSASLAAQRKLTVPFIRETLATQT